MGKNATYILSLYNKFVYLKGLFCYAPNAYIRIKFSGLAHNKSYLFMLLGVFCALLRGRVVAVSYILELSREIYVFRLCAKATTVTAQQQQKSHYMRLQRCSSRPTLISFQDAYVCKKKHRIRRVHAFAYDEEDVFLFVCVAYK